MDLPLIALIALLLVGFSLISGRVAGTVVTAPMLFTGAGLLLGPAGLGWIDLELGHGSVEILAEATLLFVLFVDAARIDVGLLRREFVPALRLLGVALPLQIVLGAVIGSLLLPELGLWQAALLAAVLVATDAALGQAVVSDKRLPTYVRQTLNVESGLNDGLALPFVMILLAVCSAAEGLPGNESWLLYAVKQVGLGVAIGALGGGLAGRVIDRAEVAGWMDEPYPQISAMASAVAVYAAATALGGNGFIAAFVAGLVFGRIARHHCDRLYELVEGGGRVLLLLSFAVLGVALLPEVLEHLNVTAVIYGVLSLTVVRALPVWASLSGCRLDGRTVAFLAWFGPRGLASILFALLVVAESGIEQAATIYTTALVTVLLSIVLHGATAAPFSTLLARHLARERDSGKPMTEHRDATDLPTRVA